MVPDIARRAGSHSKGLPRHNWRGPRALALSAAIALVTSNTVSRTPMHRAGRPRWQFPGPMSITVPFGAAADTNRTEVATS